MFHILKCYLKASFIYIYEWREEKLNNVNKTVFLNAINCPTLGWIIRNKGFTKPLTISDRFLMEQGRTIGKKAQNLYPNGAIIYAPNFEENAKKTSDMLNKRIMPTLFESAFLVDNYAAKADILELIDNKWKMIEVKSGMNDKDEYIDDMAYTTMVMNKSGFDISKISLFLISPDYRLGMDDKDLFREIDHTDDVIEKVKEFDRLWDQIDNITSTDEKPTSSLRYECKYCKIFNDCIGKKYKNHLFDIPRLGKTKFNTLLQSGVTFIEDIPDGFSLSAKQNLVKDCVKNNTQHIDKNLKKDLDKIIWPSFYLDFETYQTALPLLPDTKPYEQIPTQYSIHKCSKPGHMVDHFEFLSNPDGDYREDLAKKLILDLEEAGSIIVYSSFEKRIINYLKGLYLDLKKDFDVILERLVDLEAIIRNNYYNPEFHGKTSVKVTCPVLIPEFSYDGFDISDGLTASAIFAYMMLKKYDKKEIEKHKQNLLKYCKQDTIAMVKLHEKLYTIAN